MPTNFIEKGSGKIWLDEVQCMGSEMYLTQCNHNAWGQHDCDHSEDTGVLCNAQGMRYIISKFCLLLKLNAMIVWLTQYV
jgi:hypothetical protein